MNHTDKRTKQINKAIDDFGGLLQDYRLAHNLSLDDMSQIIGCSASYVWRLENHKRFPSMDKKINMLKAIWPVEDVYMLFQKIITGEKE